MGSGATRSGGVQSVDRAIDLLEIMAAVGGSTALGDLAARAGLPLPTAHRLIRALASRGYVRQLPGRGCDARLHLSSRYFRPNPINLNK